MNTRTYFLIILWIASYLIVPSQILGAKKESCSPPKWYKKALRGNPQKVISLNTHKDLSAGQKVNESNLKNSLFSELDPSPLLPEYYEGYSQDQIDNAINELFRLTLVGIHREQKFTLVCGKYYIISEISKNKLGDAYKNPYLIREWVYLILSGINLNSEFLWHNQVRNHSLEITEIYRILDSITKKKLGNLPNKKQALAYAIYDQVKSDKSRLKKIVALMNQTRTRNEFNSYLSEAQSFASQLKTTARAYSLYAKGAKKRGLKLLKSSAKSGNTSSHLLICRELSCRQSLYLEHEVALLLSTLIRYRLHRLSCILAAILYRQIPSRHYVP